MTDRSMSRGGSSNRPSGPPGKRCYAIGDVHGRLDLLQEMMAMISAREADLPRKEVAIVMLGDLIDRGPCSREIIDYLMDARNLPARTIFLMGNHEEMLVRGLTGEPQLLTNWLSSGGDACARSYGVETGALIGQSVETIEAVVAPHIPRRHLAFMNSFANSARFGDYLLVHAGIRPGVPLAEQRESDLRWIRKEFLESPLAHEFVVVHGHSVSAEIEERDNRIGVDTGAYRTGILTAVWLEDDQRGFMQTRGAEDASLEIYKSDKNQ